MNVLIGIHEGGFNGIDAYAEQAAAAVAQAGATVTLLAATAKVAEGSRERLSDPNIEIIDMGLTQPGRYLEIAQRLWHGVRMQRLGAAFERCLANLDRTFDVVHLNHPGLAGIAQPWAERVVVAAWFHPHQLIGRMCETWRHTRGSIPRRPLMTAKSIAFYRSDERGYRQADVVLCPTQTLADQLCGQGRSAVVCPPPVRLLGESHKPGPTPGETARTRRLLVCCGDLTHPRKNIPDIVRAAGLLPASLGEVEVTIVGGRSEFPQSLARALPNHVRVEFPGRMQPASLHTLMGEVDCFVIPSLYEEWGYVVVESLLSGTPVVAYPVHPFPDMLAGGFGVVADEVTPAALARAIETCLNTPRPSDIAPRAAARFGGDAIGKRLLAIYRGDPVGELGASESTPTGQEVA